MNSVVSLTSHPRAKHLIVFVHGFTGGGDTFRSANGKRFDELLDPAWTQHCDFSSYIYHSKAFDFRFTRLLLRNIPLLGRIFSLSSNRGLERYAALLHTHYVSLERRYDSVNFVCHSMGGVIVKELILMQMERHGSFRGFYITLATPHRGVEQAKSIGAMLGNPQVKHLAPFNESLERQQDRWALHANAINAHYYCAIDDDVVSERSASPVADRNRLTVVDGNHTTICKPDSSGSVLIAHLNDLIPHFLGLRPNTTNNCSDTYTVEDVLFLAYRPEVEPFYVERAVDRFANDAVASGNLWLAGLSSVGKTNCLQRLAYSFQNRCYVDLSPLPADSQLDAMLEHIRWTLAQTLGGASVTNEKINGNLISHLGRLLCAAARTGPVALCIDEVPSNDVARLSEFAAAMVRIAMQCSGVTGVHAARMIVSSHCVPSVESSGDNLDEKLRAHFVMETMRPWHVEELEALYFQLSGHLGLEIARESMPHILTLCDGSPRILKAILKRLVLGVGDSLTKEEIAVEVASQFRTK